MTDENASDEVAVKVLAETPAPKKGRATWRPATLLDVQGKDPAFVYRWLLNDPANIAKKKAEGWEVLSKTTTGSDKSKHVKPGVVGDGESLTSVVQYRELILGRIPKEMAEARAEYFQAITKRQTLRVKQELLDNVQKAAGSLPAAPVHGEIITR